jgi:LytS/YehU family sensor histidine kinase
MDPTTSTRDLLFTLLLKVGVASSIAALLARWNTFRRVLFTEERDPDQKLKLMLFMTPPLILGVTLRLVGFPYRFADLSLEGAFLMGLLGGRVVGPLGGAIITIPALIGHEWLGMPAAATAGLIGGLIRQAFCAALSLPGKWRRSSHVSASNLAASRSCTPPSPNGSSPSIHSGTGG